MAVNILKAVLALSMMGLVFGLILGFAAKIFAVKVDEKEEAIKEVLPGANCGGCGYAGCAAYAAALAKGEAPTTACAAGGSELAEKVAAILGVEAGTVERKTAVVLCCGKEGVSQKKYEYKGVMDCYAAVRIGGGERECPSSCLGLGTCMQSCAFGAIKMVDSVAVVDREKCTACGVCVTKCPKGVIGLLPYDAKYAVVCSSAEKGGEVRKYCSAGCIGCKLCEKACPEGAIKVDGNVARIDYTKCTSCGACVAKCPRNIIHDISKGAKKEAAAI